MEQDIGAQLEGIGQPIGRNGPRLGQIADDFRIIRRVEFEQGGIMRRDRVEKSERGVAVAVVIVGLDGDRELERAAAFWGRFGGSRVRPRAGRQRA